MYAQIKAQEIFSVKGEKEHGVSFSLYGVRIGVSFSSISGLTGMIVCESFFVVVVVVPVVTLVAGGDFGVVVVLVSAVPLAADDESAVPLVIFAFDGDSAVPLTLTVDDFISRKPRVNTITHSMIRIEITSFFFNFETFFGISVVSTK